MIENASLERFDERIASLKSLLDKKHIGAARQFAIGFEEYGDFEDWVMSKRDKIAEVAVAPLDALREIDSGEEAMLVMHAIYFLSVGRILQEQFQKWNPKLHNASDALSEISWMAHRVRITNIPFWPFDHTNIPLVDGYQNAAESWW